MSSNRKTELIGKFDDYGSVQDAVLELKMAGFRRDHVRLLQPVADPNQKTDAHPALPHTLAQVKPVDQPHEKQNHLAFFWGAGITAAILVLVGMWALEGASLLWAFLLGVFVPAAGAAIFMTLNRRRPSKTHGERSGETVFTVTVTTLDKGKKIAATYILQTCGARTIKAAC